jgi:hypothetical protein
MGVSIGELGGRLYFGARDAVGDMWLWSTDAAAVAGNAVATAVAKLGPPHAVVRSFRAAGDGLYFSTSTDSAAPDNFLWVTRGTAQTTSILHSFANADATTLSNFFAWEDRLIFRALRPVGGAELWTSDGTPEGTFRLAPFGDVQMPVDFNGTLFFGASHPDHGLELFAVLPSAAPDAPNGLVATPAPQGALALSWFDRATTETGYRIERSPRADFASIDATFFAKADSTSYLDATAAGLTRFYRVVAYNPKGDSALSEIAAGWPLRVSEARFINERPAHAVALRFNGPTRDPLLPTDISVINLTTATTVDPATLALAFDAGTQTWTLTFPGYVKGSLPEGRYRLTIAAGAVADDAGRPLDGDGDSTPGGAFGFAFAEMAADIGGDGAVDFNDLSVIAQYYNSPGRTRSQGDLNYDGNVDFDDLAMLAQRYNTSLPPVPAGAVAVAAQLPGGSTGERRQTAKPLFNATVPIHRKKPAKSLARGI